MSDEYFINEDKSDISELVSLINKEQYDRLEDAWLEIVESNNKNLKALFVVIDLLAKREEKKRAHDFLTMLVPYYKQKGLYHDAFEVLKRILEYNPKEKGLIKEVAECYSNIYKNRSYTKTLIERTCMETVSDIRTAIKKLEKYFFLDQGDYVYHKSWGVGQVIAINTEEEKVIVDFEKKSNHSIAMDITTDILQKLDKDDLLVMVYSQKDVLNKMAIEDPVSLIKLAIKYFKGKASISNIKSRLTSDIIPVEAWSKWWTNTKKLLKKDPYIKLTEGSPATSFIEIRTSPVTHHQEILEKLISTKDIDKRVEITKKYISEMKDSEQCTDTLHEISSILTKDTDKLYDTNPSIAIECLLLLQEIENFLKGEPVKYKNRIETYISSCEDFAELIGRMNILEYKKYILGLIKKAKPEEWQEVFVSIFFINDGNLWEFIIKELIAENKNHSLEKMSLKVFNQFNACPEHFIWFFKNYLHGRYTELYQNIDPAIMFNRLIELLDNAYFKIQKGRDGDLKPIINKIKNLLEDTGIDYVANILNDANAESIFNVISSSKGLEDWFKVSVESIIQDRFPDMFRKPGPPKLDENKVYTTKEGYEKRKREFDYVMNVEFPENARDLGEAISRGDLRENAEYKAAREKQAMLVEKAERMKAELQKVVIIEPHSVQPNIVTPGTKVTLNHQKKSELEIYTLLGPWDVDIERGIISYLSPIGKGLLNKKVGEVITIKLPEGESTYEIMKIERAL